MSSLPSRLADAIGADAVNTAPDIGTFMSSDVYRTGGAPIAVICPSSIAALQAAVRVCAQAGVVLVPRGGGASYTDGYLYGPGGHVLVDTGRLDTIAIDAGNAVVTVGAGVTWARLKAELDALELRTPFWGPFSGIAATIGGSMSQNTVSHGSGAYGISAQSALSMDVVLANGELLSTAPSTASRHYGPDLTGLFTGDCGALGIKASIRLPLIAAREHFATVSFAFPDFPAYHAALSQAQRAHLDDTHFGIDLALSQGQIGKAAGLGARLQIAREVLRVASGPIAGLRQLIRMALAGDNAMRAGAQMAHFIIEGISSREVADRASALRAILARHGKEIANSVPAFVRALPFAPLTNILGPHGERWVPLHGILAHDRAVPFHDALTNLYARRKAEMERVGVWAGAMFSPVGSSGFLYEIALYWPDARNAFHDTVLDADQLAALPEHAANATSRAVVDNLKAEMIALYQEYGAAHFQIGRAYPYRQRLDPQADALLLAIKSQLDPHNLMNPGVLGLGD